MLFPEISGLSKMNMNFDQFSGFEKRWKPYQIKKHASDRFLRFGVLTKSVIPKEVFFLVAGGPSIWFHLKIVKSNFITFLTYQFSGM